MCTKSMMVGTEVFKCRKKCVLKYRVSQKKSGISTISIKLNTNLLEIYLILKVGSIDPFGVQKHFCTISESQDES